MEILRRLTVPTGDICIVKGDLGQLEFLSLGDYGQDINLNQHKPVKHCEILPLTKKWVVTVSTQYGCSMGCTFCDVPKVGPGKNATFNDLVNQVFVALEDLHPGIKQTDRLNIHFARMGEPTWNPAVILAAQQFNYSLNPEFNVHPVVSTMMPWKNNRLHGFLKEWMHIKNDMYGGNAGLQLSINSTSDYERDQMFSGNSHELAGIARIMDRLPNPVGRKITLNFAVAGYEIDPSVLLKYFDPDYYIVKLTPMHKTTTALDNNIQTDGDYTDFRPYLHHEEALKSAGYEVLTFIASAEEDLGRITCGNAILSGTLPQVEYTEI